MFDDDRQEPGLFLDEQAFEPTDRFRALDADDQVEELGHDLGVAGHSDAGIGGDPDLGPSHLLAAPTVIDTDIHGLAVDFDPASVDDLRSPVDELMSPADEPVEPVLDGTLDADVGVTDDRLARIDPLPDPNRMVGAIECLRTIGGSDGARYAVRLAYSAGEREAHGLFAAWLRSAGFSARVDAVGNTIGERPGGADLPFLTLGCHLDTAAAVGGVGDIAGAVAALEVGRMVQENGIVTRHPLRIVAFAGHHVARFDASGLGALAVVGRLGAADAAHLRDADGTSLGEVMLDLGLNPAGIEDARWGADDVAAYLELGAGGFGDDADGTPTLDLVDTVAGQTVLRVSVSGSRGASGRTPTRGDGGALAGAAEMVLAVEHAVADSQQRGLSATVARFELSSQTASAEAPTVTFDVDLRQSDGDHQRRTARNLTEQFARIAAGRGLKLEHRVVADYSPVVLPAWLRRLNQQACADLGFTHRVSVAATGRDAQILARHLPVAAVLVRGLRGLDDAPAVQRGVAALTDGVRALFGCLLRLDRFLAHEVA